MKYKIIIKKSLNLLLLIFCFGLLPSFVSAQASSQGIFLENWLPKYIEIKDYETLEQIALPSTVTVTVDAGTIVSKVSRNVYGHNAAVWGGKLEENASLVNDVINLSPQVVRWPGGNMSNDYFWNATSKATCPVDLPPTAKYNDQLYGANKNSWTMSLDSYYSFLDKTNSTGIICVNYAYARYSTSNDPVLTAARYAADWVRYDNGRTKYWEIGNENYGKWETGYTIDQSLNKDGQPLNISGDLYGKHCKVFLEEMRKAAKEVGNDIKIGVVVYNTEGLKFDAVEFWNKGVMSQVAGQADFLIAHYYFSNNTESDPTKILNTAIADVPRIKTMLNQQLKTFAGMDPMPVALTEYNINPKGKMQQVSYINGIHGTLVLGELIKNQFGQGNRWDFMNGWSDGDSHGLFADGEPGIARYIPRAPFFYLYYFQKYFGDKLIPSTVSGSSDVVSYASLFSSGQSGLVLVNKGADAQVVNLKMNNFKSGDKYYYYLLTGGTDNDNLSRKVLVNGKTTTNAGGGPADYATLKPFGTSISGDIKLSLTKYSTVYVLVENDKNLQSQTIQFDPIPSKVVGDADFSLSASASSGLLCTYTNSNPAVATIENGKVQIKGAGVATITAQQSGNVNYNAAPEVSQELVVALKTAVEQLSVMNDFEIFPNPATDLITIGLNSENSRISIYNSWGSLVYSNVVSASVNTIPVSQIGGNGVYFVQVNSTTKKLIVIHSGK